MVEVMCVVAPAATARAMVAAVETRQSQHSENTIALDGYKAPEQEKD